jgi:trigger factor
VIERQFGKQIRQQAIEHFVRQAFEQAVKENELKVVGFQRLDFEKVAVLEGADFVHELEVSLRPEIALGEYKGLEVQSELEPVMEPEVESAIANLRAQQSRPDPAGDEGLPKDGVAVAKVEWLSGTGEVVLSRDVRVSPQSPTPGVEAAAFEAALSGARDGEVRDVAMTFPADAGLPAELVGQPGTTRVHVQQAYRLVPPTDEDLWKLAQVEDQKGFEELVRRRLAEAKADRENQRVETVLVERLVGAHAFDLPAPMLEEQTRARLAQERRNLEAAGVPADQVDAQLEPHKDRARASAERGLRALFLVQAIAEKEQLLVGREDMQKELSAIAERNQASLDEVTEYYRKNNLFDQMAIEILERKVRRFLRESARITEPA